MAWFNLETIRSSFLVVILEGTNLRSSKDVGKETPIGPAPWARRGDVLKAERQAKYHSVVIQSIESGVDRPARNCGREVPCESDVYEGAPHRSLEGRCSATVLNMEAMTEEEVIEVCTTGVLVRAIEGTMCIGVNGQKKPGGMEIYIL